jgi:thiol:disulfide interchange protein DsbD
MRWIAVQFLFVACLFTPAAAAPRTDLVKAKLLADVSAVKPGQPFTVGVLLKIAPHYHVYWINPGDSGQTTAVELKASPLSRIEPIQFPTPVRIELPGGLVNYGYENAVMLLAKVTPPANPQLDTTTMQLSANVSWLVCNETECIPGDAKLSMSLPIFGSAVPANVAIFKSWQDQIPRLISAGDAHADPPPSDLKIEVSWPGMRDEAFSKVEWFPGNNDPLIIKDIKVTPSATGVRVNARVELLAGQALQRNTIESVLGYTDGQGRRRGLSLSVPLRSSANVNKGQ